MYHYLVELYTPKAAWKSLNTLQRRQFLDSIGAAMSSLSEIGVEVLTLADIDPDIEHSSEHRFLGIWRFPDVQARNTLLAGIQASGWYSYFEHVNAAAKDGEFSRHLQALENV